jgi:alcohol dehydrogenase class IV
MTAIANKKYHLKFPPDIIFGTGAVDKLGDFFSEKRRILVIIGSGAKKNDLDLKLKKILPQESESLFLSGIVGYEAPIEAVDEIIKVGREFQADCVAAVGGGSIIDAAKAAAAIIPLDGNAGQYFSGEKKIRAKGLYFAAVPTTAGTGAEITENAVLSEKKTLLKKSIRGKELIPDLAIVDPALTFSCPPMLTTDSGMDALVQAIESLASPFANSATSALAEKAVSLIFSNLERAFRNGNDADARCAMAEGSLLTALSFSQTGLGAVHGLASPVGIKLNVAHGRTCAILAGEVFRANLKRKPGLYDGAAHACGLASSRDFLSAFGSLRERLSIPANFAEYNFDKSYFAFIIKNCRGASMDKNACQYSDAEIADILEKLT